MRVGAYPTCMSLWVLAHPQVMAVHFFDFPIDIVPLRLKNIKALENACARRMFRASIFSPQRRFIEGKIKKETHRRIDNPYRASLMLLK